MILVKTPARVSFCGGGSDIPAFYEKHGGIVISASLSKYVYTFVRQHTFPDKTMCRYMEVTESVDKPSQIKNPILRTVLEQFGINGIDITIKTEIPPGTGLGSSSSLTVGLINALYAYKKNRISAKELAQEACRTEIELMGNPIGKQDQYAVAYGGMNVFRFRKDGNVDVEPIILEKEIKQRLEKNLLMFYIGGTHSAADILSEQMVNIANDSEKEQAQLKICKYTEELRNKLLKGEIDDIGSILNANWEQKRCLSSKISSPFINQVYELALSAGASGGKLLGAGGGGYFLFYVPEQYHNDVKNALVHLKYMEFGFSSCGSSIVSE